MQLKYMPDWAIKKEMFSAWWAHEYIGRCAIAITAPRAGATTEPPPEPEKVEDKWLNKDYLHKKNEYRMNNTFFGGEALAVWSPGYPGWANIQSYLGAEIELRKETTWKKPMIHDKDITKFDFKNLTIDPNNYWWNLSKDMHYYSVDEAKGKSIPGILNLAGVGDILASLRDTENLLYDIIDNPEYVKKFLDYLTDIWIDVYDTFYNIIKEGAEGSTTFLALWAPGRYYALSCDFSYMISPKMFNDIFLPSIERLTHFLDYSIYHVDGVGSFNHVDALCELPRLKAIQILPGAGKPSPLYYMDKLKKVQSSGKNLWIHINPKDIEAALNELSAIGLFISTSCETEEEARYILKMTEKWSKDR